MANVIWVTWEEQRRNKAIADHIGAKFFELAEIRKHSILIRYIVGIWKTLKIFLKERPDTVIVQNPSFVLALFAVLASPILHFRVGVDTHNGGFATNPKGLLSVIKRFIQRNADFIIAHNPGIADQMGHVGGNIIILPDKIPTIAPPSQLKKLDGKHNFLYICSFAEDEPYDAVIGAFTRLDSDYHVYITGNYKKAGLDPNMVNRPNIHFLGRVPWDEYDQMLYSVDATIVLTERENCLQCGAYESVAAEKPMILSDTNAMMQYFYCGALYNDNTVGGISWSVVQLVNWWPESYSAVKTLRDELTSDWNVLAQQLINKL